MADEIRDLIEKIQEEGIRAAEERGREIEAAARARAEEILREARREADRMTAEAGERIRRQEESGRALLAQAGRDLFISLRNEIQAMLARIAAKDTGAALSPDVLSGLIQEVVHRFAPEGEDEILVLLSKEDREALEGHLLHRLGEETRRGIVLRPSDGISGGFVISFDGGRSAWDFTDRALAEYMAGSMKPKLRAILDDAVKD